ncbi:hypothetical protein GCM10011376_24710 [Nocardioides flavus (ex Wang et al. 2016)]|uniref:DUF5134 domain-containing protein n=1 Tax=Nocardioides flavus (ex Wang et al. 2016) TaxID=2058780 RepID=A0ABQ3HJY8_9ACTN|nr:hypothetical protein [Nocardioides flavus (ex Wang et al. 2016)]GHE17861.1 hypothetical protein GCM10011376_24710 [Nocardioides flavus (ex Wang et al. 2016)]
MSFPVVVWILTALAAVVVVLTRLRLSGEGAAGRFSISRRVPMAHFVSGLVALVLWVGVLLAPEDSALGGPLVGIAAIASWWVTAICGLLILARWLPARGRHVPEAAGDGWSDGPGLSLLAHLGMVVGVLVFTYAYLTAAV